MEQFIHDMLCDFKVVEEYYNDPAKAVAKYNMSPAEREALISRDIEAISQLGVDEKIADFALSGGHRTIWQDLVA